MTVRELLLQAPDGQFWIERFIRASPDIEIRHIIAFKTVPYQGLLAVTCQFDGEPVDNYTFPEKIFAGIGGNFLWFTVKENT